MRRSRICCEDNGFAVPCPVQSPEMGDKRGYNLFHSVIGSMTPVPRILIERNELRHCFKNIEHPHMGFTEYEHLLTCVNIVKANTSSIPLSETKAIISSWLCRGYQGRKAD